jgi:hypothetical protein
MNAHELEIADLLKLKDAEIASLQEELGRERARRVSAEQEAELCFHSAREITQENVALKKKLQSEAFEL